jgi:hypothetical protein
MNTYKILDKSISTGIFVLFLVISFSFSIYGEEAVPKIQMTNSSNTDEGMLFAFMRANYKLEVYAAATGVDVTKGDDEVLASLPYRGLYHKLQNKLLDLAVEEAKNAISQNAITEEMQRMMTAIITEAGGSFDRVMLAFREKFKDYQNTSDLISLNATSINDAKEISELSAALSKGDAKERDVSKELLRNIFEHTVDGYRVFIAQNEDALNIISKLVDDGYKFEEMTVKCKPFAGHEVCETEKSVKEIKNFSEIMPYVIGVQEKKRIKDPSVSFIPTDF